jgi:hypothetical protein
MKQLLITLTTIFMLVNNTYAQVETIKSSDIQHVEHQLNDVMEIIDTSLLKLKLVEVEAVYNQLPNEINKARLGIIYHETALNLTFLSKSPYKGYAKKSFNILTELSINDKTTKALLPFIDAYRASALSLVGGETRKLKLVGQAFKLFNKAVNDYAAISYMPEFLRGSVAENLPKIFFIKRKFAKKDMQSLIDKYSANNSYANNKIMSFVWAWANQHQSKKHRATALNYLEKAIALDGNSIGGRKRAEDLKAKMLK